MASLDELYNKLKKGDSHSLLKKYLTQDVYDKLKGLKSKLGGTLADCIRSGCENLHSHCGVYACDPEGYDTFADLLHPVIKDYHKVPEVKHPKPDFGDLSNLGFGDLDPKNEYILSTRVRVGRSHAAFAFPPVSSKEDKVEMEKQSVAALNSLTGELAGEYFPLEGMTKEVQTQLTADHFLFNDHDSCLRSAGGYNDWPTGRGIFFNKNKTFLVWVNEEDHLRLISMQKGGNLKEIYTRLVNVSNYSSIYYTLVILFYITIFQLLDLGETI
ncbi:arginine kinase-like [Mytilus galloprovincialis]|uniref:arginine kinase-like n=1 Tax=Mytilus galloprovincialis TaxID=29158 RepID=UPI003F7BA638